MNSRKTHDSIRTPLGRARGLGSAHAGTHHWWMQRVTSIALIPLTMWMMACIACLTNDDYGSFIAWVQEPMIAIGIALFVIVSFYHAALGLQVVIEDYVTCKASRIASLLAVQFACFAGAFICLFALLRINFAITG